MQMAIDSQPLMMHFRFYCWGTRWSEKIAPAILQLAEEMGKTSPKSDELNGILKSICVVQAYINWHCDLIYKLLTLTMYNHCELFLA